MNVHFSSKTPEWSTPPAFFAEVEKRFGPFHLDPAATAENTKAPRWFTREDNGLLYTWGGVGSKVWLNPPYGRGIGLWVAKAVLEAGAGATVVCLLPARTDTRWWHDLVMKHGKIEFIRGRLKFGGCKNGAPFPSALVIFELPVQT